MPGYKEFMQKTFKTKFFQPTTELGHFDAFLDPLAGTLTIYVTFSFTYTNMYFSLAYPQIQEIPDGHDLKLIRLFAEAAAKYIPKLWNDRFQFVLSKKGWPKIQLKTLFVVKEAPLKLAHYEIQLSDSSREWSNQAVVTEKSRGSKRAHFATFSSDVSGYSGSEEKLRQMVEDLVKGYEIPLSNYKSLTAQTKLQKQLQSKTKQLKLMSSLLETESESDIWGKSQFEDWQEREVEKLRKLHKIDEYDESQGLKRLGVFVQELRKALGNTTYQKFQLLIRLQAPINRYGSLIEYVYKYIPSKERMIMKIEHSFSSMDSEERSISIALRSAEVKGGKLQEHVNRIVGIVARTSLMNSRQFGQITICHEFGHMLGLPDEYICLTKASRDLLKNLDVSRARSKFSVEKWLEFQNPKGGIKRDNPTISENQKSFLVLCQNADVEAPLFGRKTSSMMSAGSKFMPCHGVTLWECLGHLTGGYVEPEDWQIKLLRE